MARMALLALCMASCTAPNPDFLPPATGCTAGVRSCSGTRPVVCAAEASGTVLTNQTCPTGGGCQGGHCIPPQPPRPCKKESDCGAGETCTAFLDAASTVGDFCVAAEGVTAGGLPCSADNQCRSNLCLDSNGQGVKQTCYLACDSDSDCTGSQKCRTRSVTVTGIRGTIQGCSPP